MWNHIVVEAFCFGEEKDDIYPCGKKYPTNSCLGKGEKCPYFAWGNSTIREGAEFVPIILILWDRAKAWLRIVWDSLAWFFWGQLWFNRRKVNEYLDNIPVVTSEEIRASGIEPLEDSQTRLLLKFKEWIKENPQMRE